MAEAMARNGELGTSDLKDTFINRFGAKKFSTV